MWKRLLDIAWLVLSWCMYWKTLDCICSLEVFRSCLWDCNWWMRQQMHRRRERVFYVSWRKRRVWPLWCTLMSDSKGYNYIYWENKKQNYFYKIEPDIPYIHLWLINRLILLIGLCNKEIILNQFSIIDFIIL